MLSADLRDGRRTALPPAAVRNSLYSSRAGCHTPGHSNTKVRLSEVLPPLGLDLQTPILSPRSAEDFAGIYNVLKSYNIFIAALLAQTLPYFLQR
jgi:hypothetical protein